MARITVEDCAAHVDSRFALCILAVLFGIVVIVYGKQLFGV